MPNLSYLIPFNIVPAVANYFIRVLISTGVRALRPIGIPIDRNTSLGISGIIYYTGRGIPTITRNDKYTIQNITNIPPRMYDRAVWNVPPDIYVLNMLP
jgi:hypothetical protein